MPAVMIPIVGPVVGDIFFEEIDFENTNDSDEITNVNEDEFYTSYETSIMEDHSFYFTINSFVVTAPTNSTKVEFTIPVEFNVFNPQYVARLYYIGSDNTERLYLEDNAKAKITLYDKYYEYPVSLDIGDNEYYIFNFEIQPFVGVIKQVLSFRLDFPSQYVNLGERERIYYRYECMTTVGRHNYYQARPVSFIDCEKDIYYYHKFSFKDFIFSYSTKLASLGTPYLYIYDTSTRFLNALNTLSGMATSLKFLELEFIYNGVTTDYTLKAKDQLYYSLTTNIMYKTNEEGVYGEVDDAIHMPRKYYDEYKTVTLGLYIEGFSSYGYNLYYEFEVNFEENYIQDVGVIYKDEKAVSGGVSGTEITL